MFPAVNNKTQLLLRYLPIENKLVCLFTLQSRCQNPNSSFTPCFSHLFLMETSPGERPLTEVSEGGGGGSETKL